MLKGKGFLIIVIVGILIMVIIGGLLFPARPKQDTTISQTSPTPQKISTYQEFLQSGRSEICTFKINIGTQTTNGTVYATAGKLLASFPITGDNGTFQQYMLVDSLTAYLWTNLNNSGVKFALKEKSPEELSGSLLPFDCRAWAPDMSVFQLPSNVAFTEITAPPISLAPQR